MIVIDVVSKVSNFSHRLDLIAPKITVGRVSMIIAGSVV